MNNAVQANDVSFFYAEQPILRHVNIEIKEGEFIGIIGPNGGGKTTLLKILMGFLTPRTGSIQIFNKTPEKARLSIGYVPQAHRFDRSFPITTYELILMGALSNIPAIGKIPADIADKAGALIDHLGLTPHQHKSFGALSGGLAQRALLARALLSEPNLLLLDEPTANIDPPSALLIIELLQQLKGEKTILLVTHDLKTIIERVDRILCVEGTVHSFFAQDVCEHFAFGLYHTPLLDVPINHFFKKKGT